MFKALLSHLHTIDALQNWESNIKLVPESLTKMFFFDDRKSFSMNSMFHCIRATIENNGMNISNDAVTIQLLLACS